MKTSIQFVITTICICFFLYAVNGNHLTDAQIIMSILGSGFINVFDRLEKIENSTKVL